MKELTVGLDERSYPIYIGAGLLAAAPFYECKTAVVITDENVIKLHGDKLKSYLEGRGVSHNVITVKPGEQSKSLEVLAGVYSQMASSGAKRNTLVVAFGGGVVGDLAGFAAATYMRGVPFIQIPTTLLAQVDSAVGGKVAVNIPEGKNLIGSFYQPRLVLSDTELLGTLPEREWTAGLGEVVKYAFLGNEAVLSFLEGGGENIEEIVFECCKTKAELVESDEKDRGARMFLNLGHTFGHAIEKFCGYSGVNHGEAVIKGTDMELSTGVMLGLTPPELRERYREIIKRHGLDIKINLDMKSVIEYMAGDKKNTDERVNCVFLQDIGKPFMHMITKRELLLIWGDNADA